MSNVAQQVIETILEKARSIARSETLLGEPITFNDILVVPVIQVSIGFGAGGGEGSGPSEEGKSALGSGAGGGGGGGIKVEPSCFLVYDGGSVRILSTKPTKGKGVDALIERLPDLLTYAMDSLKNKGEKSSSDSSNETKKSDEG
ncbi:GerW family sporulation protein [bacterium]|nr:GerW family sporulation protein [bacterium]